MIASAPRSSLTLALLTAAWTAAACTPDTLDVSLVPVCQDLSAGEPPGCEHIVLSCANVFEISLLDPESGKTDRRCLTSGELGNPRTLCDLLNREDRRLLFDGIETGRRVTLRLRALMRLDPESGCEPNDATPSPVVVLEGQTPELIVDDSLSRLDVELTTCGGCNLLPPTDCLLGCEPLHCANDAYPVRFPGAASCCPVACMPCDSAGAPACEEPTTFFSWDLEASHEWAGPPCANTSFVSEGCRGERCLQIAVRGDDDGNQQSGLETHPFSLGPFVGGGWVHYRWWMKLDAGFRWGTLGKAKASMIKLTSGALLSGWLSRDGFQLGGLPDTKPWECMIPFDLQAMAGTGWHEYIVAIKRQSSASAADGIFRVFIDGAVVGEQRDLSFARQEETATEAWLGWMARPYFSMNGSASDGGRIWLDDFSVDNGWNSLVYPKP